MIHWGRSKGRWQLGNKKHPLIHQLTTFFCSWLCRSQVLYAAMDHSEMGWKAEANMQRMGSLLLLLVAGCSTAPIADILDHVKPGRIRPVAPVVSGGVGMPHPGIGSPVVASPSPPPPLVPTPDPLVAPSPELGMPRPVIPAPAPSPPATPAPLGPVSTPGVGPAH